MAPEIRRVIESSDEEVEDMQQQLENGIEGMDIDDDDSAPVPSAFKIESSVLAPADADAATESAIPALPTIICSNTGSPEDRAPLPVDEVENLLRTIDAKEVQKMANVIKFNKGQVDAGFASLSPRSQHLILTVWILVQRLEMELVAFRKVIKGLEGLTAEDASQKLADNQELWRNVATGLMKLRTGDWKDLMTELWADDKKSEQKKMETQWNKAVVKLEKSKQNCAKMWEEAEKKVRAKAKKEAGKSWVEPKNEQETTWEEMWVEAEKKKEKMEKELAGEEIEQEEELTAAEKEKQLLFLTHPWREEASKKLPKSTDHGVKRELEAALRSARSALNGSDFAKGKFELVLPAEDEESEEEKAGEGEAEEDEDEEEEEDEEDEAEEEEAEESEDESEQEESRAGDEDVEMTG